MKKKHQRFWLILKAGRGIEAVLKTAEQLMAGEIEKQKRRGRMQKTTRVMILGIPNVGKSSLINRIAKRTPAQVGNRPGVTKQKQWVRLGQNQELLDTPGVLWPRLESEEVALNLAFTGTIKDELFDRVEVSFQLLKRLYAAFAENICARYHITAAEIDRVQQEENFIYALMQLIGRKRGAIRAGGVVDDEKTARIMLDDFRNGKWGQISLEQPKM